MERLGKFRFEPVEPTHFVGAVVGAVPRADAAVVNLRVQAFVGVIRGVDGANRLARRVIAVLAQQRDETHIACDKPLDPQPRHRPATLQRFCPHDRHVVFGITRCDTRVAPRASIQIDCHAPAMHGMTVFRRQAAMILSRPSRPAFFHWRRGFPSCPSCPSCPSHLSSLIE
jgi:hypothetical protein